MRGWRRMRGVALVAAALTTAGCSQAGALGDVLGGVLNPQGGSEAQLQGDVVGVSTSQQYLQVRLPDGRTANVRFDNRTQVVYRQQTYPVTALERGDVVSLRVQQTSQGELYTDQILVTQSVQEINGTGGGAAAVGQYMQLSGTVGAVDTQRGMFELRGSGGAAVWVSLPYNASSTTTSRFRTLRSGQAVRIGGRYVSQQRFELETFL